MKAAMIGCGKLGFPVALAWATKHDMVGYDVSMEPDKIMASGKYPHLEPACQKLLDDGVRFPIVDTVAKAVAHADVVFVAVQTPHKPEFEGLNRMPAERADFGYETLKEAVQAVSDAAKAQQKHIVMVVISTVLPGTTKRELRPIFGDNPFVSFVYSPMFIAQGTVVEDTMKPEMVLLGRDAEDSLVALETMREFYAPLHKAPLCPMNVASAELAKVAYNVFLGLKIVAANSIMEIAHKTDANCDDVTDALALATDRVVSKKYMRGGMGDGGGCHPRDQIALSWLAHHLNLSYDLFGAMVHARESQTEWLAKLCLELAERGDEKLPVIVLGRAYKAGTNLTIGSPAVLLKNILDESGGEVLQWDPYVDGPQTFTRRAVFVIGTNHDEFYSPEFKLPSGSYVIDPWGRFKTEDASLHVTLVGRAVR